MLKVVYITERKGNLKICSSNKQNTQGNQSNAADYEMGFSTFLIYIYSMLIIPEKAISDKPTRELT